MTHTFSLCTCVYYASTLLGELSELWVRTAVVVSKINNMKENKSPGVDGISPKLLKETVEQISTPLAHVFNMSLQELYLLNGRKQTLFLYSKKVQETSRQIIGQ